LEVMTHACRYAVANDQSGFTSWRTNENQPPAFGNSVDIIGLKPAGKAIDEKLRGRGLFYKPDGVMRALYWFITRRASLTEISGKATAPFLSQERLRNSGWITLIHHWSALRC
jgi:hypothetical protein